MTRKRQSRRDGEPPLTAAERSANYRARQKGIGPEKQRPGPRPTTARALRDKVARLELELQECRETAALERRSRQGVAAADRAMQDRLWDLEQRNDELEHLVRTGFPTRSTSTGHLPLTPEQYLDLCRAKEDDDADLAREILIDAWDTWRPGGPSRPVTTRRYP